MKMFWPIMASCTALLLSGAPAITAPQGPSRPPAPSATSELDADAVQALNKMGEALRSHGVFAVTMDVSSEDVLQSGQKLQYVGTVEIRARRPDRFKWSIASDIKKRDIYYDGKSVTVFAPRLGVYTTFAAPGTIAETLAQ